MESSLILLFNTSRLILPLRLPMERIHILFALYDSLNERLILITMSLLVSCLLETCLVAGLPYLSKRYSAMEPMENAQWQSDPLHNCPSKVSIEVKLNWIEIDFVSFERVNDPHGNVAHQQEGNNLPTRFASVMFRQVDSPAGDVRDEEHLKHHLSHCKKTCDHHQEIWFMSESRKRASYHAKSRIDEETKGWNSKENIVQITLFLGFEFQALHANKSNDNGYDRECHQETMWSVCQVDCQQAHSRIANQYEEADETYQWTH